MQNIKKLLQEYGLDEKEVSLYLASLMLGEQGMSALAKKAGLKRSTAYLIFKSLEQKGLMGSFRMRSGLRFVPTRPEIFLSKAKHNLQELESIVPQLKGLERRPDEGPKITYYEGKEGYLVAAEDSLKTPNRTVYHIGSLTELHRIIGLDYDINYYIPQRIKKNIKFKALYFASELVDAIKKRDHLRELREIRFLPEEYKYLTSMLIYGNKVAIFSTKKDLITVIIESDEITEGERNKFDLLWSLIGKVQLDTFQV